MEVPEDHEREQRAYPHVTIPPEDLLPSIHIVSGETKPTDAFAKMYYDGVGSRVVISRRKDYSPSSSSC